MAAAGRGRHRRETDLPEADLLGEVAVDALDVERPAGQRDARAYWTRAVPLQQLLDLRLDDVVAAGAVVEDAELVLDLFRPVDRDRDADALLGEKFDHLGLQQRAIGGDAEVDFLADLGVAPLKKVMCATLLSPDSLSMNSTLWRAVSSLMNLGFFPFSVSTILSSLYS